MASQSRAMPARTRLSWLGDDFHETGCWDGARPARHLDAGPSSGRRKNSALVVDYPDVVVPGERSHRVGPRLLARALDANPRPCGMRGRCTGKSVEALLGSLSLCPYRLSVQRLEVCYKRTSGLDPLQVVPAEQNHYPPPSHPGGQLLTLPK